jgi:hypothetical protein
MAPTVGTDRESARSAFKKQQPKTTTKNNTTMTKYSLIILALAATTWTACGHATSTNEQAHTHATGDSTATQASEELAYACPMHPEVTGKEGDKCSKCGMYLEPLK